MRRRNCESVGVNGVARRNVAPRAGVLDGGNGAHVWSCLDPTPARPRRQQPVYIVLIGKKVIALLCSWYTDVSVINPSRDLIGCAASCKADELDHELTSMDGANADAPPPHRVLVCSVYCVSGHLQTG